MNKALIDIYSLKFPSTNFPIKDRWLKVQKKNECNGLEQVHKTIIMQLWCWPQSGRCSHAGTTVPGGGAGLFTYEDGS